MKAFLVSRVNAVIYNTTEKSTHLVYIIHCESKKLGHFFTAYNFRNIEQIVAKFGTNHVLFMLNIMS